MEFALFSLGFFGYDSAQPVQGTPEGGVVEKEDHLFVNTTNLIGYVPILGIIAGIFRFLGIASGSFRSYAISHAEPWDRKVQAVQIIRGACEILGCGLVFLIPDIIVSIGRFLSQQCHRSSHQESIQ